MPKFLEQFYDVIPTNDDKPAYDTYEERKVFAALFMRGVLNCPELGVTVEDAYAFERDALYFNRPWYMLRRIVIQKFGGNTVPACLQPTMYISQNAPQTGVDVGI